jgi:hypothetical protein
MCNVQFVKKMCIPTVIFGLWPISTEKQVSKPPALAGINTLTINGLCEYVAWYTTTPHAWIRAAAPPVCPGHKERTVIPPPEHRYIYLVRNLIRISPPSPAQTRTLFNWIQCTPYPAYTRLTMTGMAVMTSNNNVVQSAKSSLALTQHSNELHGRQCLRI